LSRVRYADPPVSATEQQLRLLNGTLNKYLIGFAWHLGGFSVGQINEQWDWGADWNYNQSSGHAPSAALLDVSRIPSALLLAAGVVVMFALGRALQGRPAAYLASLYYALNPALLLNGRRAMMEGSLTVFSLLAVLAGVWLAQKPRLWTALLLGVASGLALASKHTAVFTVIAVFGACALYPVLQWRTEKRRAAGNNPGAQHVVPLRMYVTLLVSGVLALLVFYALNPAWWGDPVTRARQVLDLRADLLAGQTAAFGGYANFAGALGGFFRQTFVTLPQYYEIPAWGGSLADQIAAYEASPWKGISLGGSRFGGIVIALLALAGLWALARRRSAADWLVGLWALAMLASTALLTPIEWQRYYLPAYPAVGLLAATGLVWLYRRYRAATAVAN
jgi:4-amino-4-deoxy-L-arabinose transferase-like glycosyltransferase